MSAVRYKLIVTLLIIESTSFTVLRRSFCLY
nr:MAG TPA: Dynein Light Chain TcTex-1 Swapping, PROTEIN TRANSPORT.7A [Caudoviricetes sp.]